MKFKEIFTEKLDETFITRLVNDARDELQKKFPGYEIEYIKMNDYDIGKQKVLEIQKREGKILYIVGNDKLLFDFKK